MYRRRFCRRYLPDLRSPPEAGRLRGGAKNPEVTGYKTFSYVKSSSIFLFASFWLFCWGSSFRSFLIYVLGVKRASSESPETQGWQWQAAWGQLYWRGVKKSDEKKNEKLKLKTILSRLWKAEWQVVPYLPKSGRYNAKCQAGKGTENTPLKIELVFRFVER